MPTISQPPRRQRRDEARRARIEREDARRAAAARRRRLVRLGAVAGAAALVVAVLIAVSTSHSGSGGATATSTPASSGAVPGAAATSALLAGIPQRGTTLGDPNAPVTVVEFADLQCPFCRDSALTQLPGIVERYVKPGKVGMQFESLAFIGPDSVRAARVAEAAASQDKLWNFVDMMYRNQGKENSGYATDAYLRRLAGAVPGLDVGKAFAARDGGAVTARLEAAQTAATKAGVRSTPTFLVKHGASTKVVDAAGLNAAIQAAVGS